MTHTGAVIIMRGIPGSGKTTFVKQKYSHATVCSADHYFIDENGKYSYDVNKIGEAHQQCRDTFKQATELGDKLIAVDNTNLSMQAMKYYITRAKECGYAVFFVRMMTPIRIALQRQTHDVPEDLVKEFAERFEELPPKYKKDEVKIKAF